ncbi:MAG: phosphodiester glycosidase family protein [Bdellovibrionota bacterium]
MGVGFGEKNGSSSGALGGVVNGPLVHPDGNAVGTIIHSKMDYKNRPLTQKLKRTDVAYTVSSPNMKPGKFYNFYYKRGIFGLAKIDDQPTLVTIQTGDWDWNESKPVYLEEGVNKAVATEFYWAFENGPVLLLDGENLHNANSTNRAVRTGIGYRDDQALVYIKTATAVTFYELADLFLQNEVSNAIFLDAVDEDMMGYTVNNASKVEDEMRDDRLRIQFYHAKVEINK